MSYRRTPSNLSPEKRAKVLAQGAFARRIGLTIDHNPYPTAADRWTVWREGWHEEDHARRKPAFQETRQ